MFDVLFYFMKTRICELQVWCLVVLIFSAKVLFLAESLDNREVSSFFTAIAHLLIKPVVYWYLCCNLSESHFYVEIHFWAPKSTYHTSSLSVKGGLGTWQFFFVIRTRNYRFDIVNSNVSCKVRKLVIPARKNAFLQEIFNFLECSSKSSISGNFK